MLPLKWTAFYHMIKSPNYAQMPILKESGLISKKDENERTKNSEANSESWSSWVSPSP